MAPPKDDTVQTKQSTWASLVARRWRARPAIQEDTGDVSSIPGSGRSPGEGNDNPLQCSCLENSMDRGARRVINNRVTKCQTQLSDKKSTLRQSGRILENKWPSIPKFSMGNSLVGQWLQLVTFHCQGPRFNSWSENQDPQAVWHDLKRN